MGYRDTDPCLAKVAEKEPIFVLRAQDKLMIPTIKNWLEMTELGDGLPTEKYEEIKLLLEEVEEWQAIYGYKWPD